MVVEEDTTLPSESSCVTTITLVDDEEEELPMLEKGNKYIDFGLLFFLSHFEYNSRYV